MTLKHARPGSLRDEIPKRRRHFASSQTPNYHNHDDPFPLPVMRALQTLRDIAASTHRDNPQIQNPPLPNVRTPSLKSFAAKWRTEALENVAVHVQKPIMRNRRRNWLVADVPNFETAERETLLAFLEQARVAMPTARTRRDLVQAAKEAVAAWEIERVLACRDELGKKWARGVLRLRGRIKGKEMRASFLALSKLIHPDKTTHVRAAEAFGVVKRAVEGVEGR